nr:putative murein biosynthesis integral membrane protein MurJ [uncultured bacterium]
MSKKLLKSTAIVSSMTLVSRISGLVRDVVMANILGPGTLADAFFVAFRIPNFLRRIFAEGAFSQAFVPVFSELTEQNTLEAKRFVNASAGFLGAVTLLMTILGIVFAPSIIRVFAPGFIDDPVKFDSTVTALRIMFPYLFCISLVAMSAGVLNTVNRFAIPAITPVLLNLCLILAMWVLVPVLENAAQALAVGVLIAGFVQLLFQVRPLMKEGFLPIPVIDLQNEAVRRVFSLMLPAIFSVSVAQVNMLVNTFLASFLVTGSVSWLYFSDRLMEFPVGVFGIALATVVLPGLSREHASGTAESFSAMMDWALRWVVMIAAPATAALYLLATPLLTTIFQYNAFSTEDVVMSATALRAFALGVCGFILIKVLAPGFFARQDTVTPMRIGVVAVAVNIVVSIILVRTMAHAGLAMAISIAAWVNAGLLFVALLRAKIFMPRKGWFWFLARIAVAVAIMAACLVWLDQPPQAWYQQGLAQRVVYLLMLVGAGTGSYLLSLVAMGVRPRQLLLGQGQKVVGGDEH